MTAETHAMLTRWLSEGDELQQQHARNRLGMAEPVEEEVIIPAADPWIASIRACEDYNPGCCASPAAYCSRFLKNVTREDCIACLTINGIRPSLRSLTDR